MDRPESLEGPVHIGFLSDYGLRDEFVGVCHGVIARRCPRARVIDITHAITRHDVRAGALALAAALPFLPVGVALAVVDPEVGSARRALALHTHEPGWLLVGPDNGLLMAAADRFGGVAQAVDIGGSPERLEPVSRTFHGRDLFAPAAAALADGAPLSSLGGVLDPRGLTRLAIPHARADAQGLHAHALRVDGFGNIALDATAPQMGALGSRLGEPVRVCVRDGQWQARYAESFADVPAGTLLIYEDAQRMLALAVNEGSAAALLALAAGEELLLARP